MDNRETFKEDKDRIINEIINLLKHEFDSEALLIIYDEYTKMLSSYLIGNEYDKVILHAARISEVLMAAIYSRYIGNKVDYNKVYFWKLCDALKDLPKKCAEDEILTLVIPSVAESIYRIRSKNV